MTSGRIGSETKKLLRRPHKLHRRPAKSAAPVNRAEATALMFACAFRTKSATPVINALLEASANLEARNDLGRTPLLFAAQHTDIPDVINGFIAAGADIHATDNNA